MSCVHTYTHVLRTYACQNTVLGNLFGGMIIGVHVAFPHDMWPHVMWNMTDFCLNLFEAC